MTDGKHIVPMSVPTDDDFKLFSGAVSESKDEAELSAATVALIGLLGALREQLQGPLTGGCCRTVQPTETCHSVGSAPAVKRNTIEPQNVNQV